MASTPSASALYLGLDSSTQGLKATAIDKDFKVVATHAINFARDLPRYKLQNGVHVKPGTVVTQPTRMVRARGASSRAAGSAHAADAAAVASAHARLRRDD